MAMRESAGPKKRLVTHSRPLAGPLTWPLSGPLAGHAERASGLTRREDRNHLCREPSGANDSAPIRSSVTIHNSPDEIGPRETIGVPDQSNTSAAQPAISHSRAAASGRSHANALAPVTLRNVSAGMPLASTISCAASAI